MYKRQAFDIPAPYFNTKSFIFGTLTPGAENGFVFSKFRILAGFLPNVGANGYIVISVFELYSRAFGSYYCINSSNFIANFPTNFKKIIGF